MKLVALLYALSITSILSLLYAMVFQNWVALFTALIMWFLIGAAFLYTLKERAGEKS